MSVLDYLVVAAYLSLAIELLCLPVPSVASTARLVAAPSSAENREAFKQQAGGRLALVVMTALMVLLFFAPLGMAVWPAFERYTIALFDPPPLVEGIGLVLVLGGRVLSVAAAVALRREALGGSTKEAEPIALVTRGVFRWSRNPVLLGMLLLYAGWLLWFPHAVVLAGFAVFFFHMHRKVLIEERFLAETFGQTYRAYCQRTRRYL